MRTGWPVAVLVVALILGTVLRLHGLGGESLSHPEIYVPGIQLPAGISEPPPRTTLAEAISFHFHSEPHPMGWYLMMLGWTDVAGTSEWALRLPSVLFATATIGVIFLVGRQMFSPAVGALAALLLALQGYHFYWSQIARMYSAGAFWSLLATYLVIALAETPRRRPWLEAAYVFTVIAGVQTTELFWAVLAMQILWVCLRLPDRQIVNAGSPQTSGQGSVAARLLQVQSIGLMLAAPALTQALYTSRQLAAVPKLQFLQEYFSFGFLFAEDKWSRVATQIDFPWSWLLLAGSLFLFGLGLRSQRQQVPTMATVAMLPKWVPLATAVAAALFMLWLASIARHRALYLAALAILPIVALALPTIGRRSRMVYSSILRNSDTAKRATDSPTFLLFLLAVVAPLLLFVLSFKNSVANDRAFLVFVPPFVVVIAAGAMTVWSRRIIRDTIIGVLVLLFALSIPYNDKRPRSPNDYKALAAQVASQMQPGDLVFMRARNWVDAPFFYYLPTATYVTDDYAGALVSHPDARIWEVFWTGPDGEMNHAQPEKLPPSYQMVQEFESLRSRARLFVPSATQ